MFNSGNPDFRPKNKVEVLLRTVDGEQLEGYLFVTGSQRPKELLDGNTDFIAFETFDGRVHLFNKTIIARVSPQNTKAQATAA